MFQASYRELTSTQGHVAHLHWNSIMSKTFPPTKRKFQSILSQSEVKILFVYHDCKG